MFDTVTYNETIKKTEELKDLAALILKTRANFDLFVCSLLHQERQILKLRCEDCKTWKDVSSEVGIAENTAKHIFRNICDMASEPGLNFMESFRG
jgi:hypothetical protein